MKERKKESTYVRKGERKRKRNENQKNQPNGVGALGCCTAWVGVHRMVSSSTQR